MYLISTDCERIIEDRTDCFIPGTCIPQSTLYHYVYILYKASLTESLYSSGEFTYTCIFIISNTILVQDN